MYTSIVNITLIILVYFILLSMGYAFLLLLSLRNTWQSFMEAERSNSMALMNQNDLVPVTAIMPACNAEKSIVNAALSVLQSEYKNLDFIIVNDGSTDKTLDVLKDAFSLYEVTPAVKQTFRTAPVINYYQSKTHPNLVVINKEHSGSPDTVQTGLNACRTPLYLTVDSDTVIEPQSISRLIFTFLSYKHTIVVGGSIYGLNGCLVENGRILQKRVPFNIVSAQQICEYLRSFLYGRAGWEKFGGTMCYPGAFTLYETQAVIEAGGYDIKNYSYDVEIVLRLHHYMRRNNYPYSIHFSPNAFAWTELPSTLKSYWKQRNHWQRGMLRSISAYLPMLFNPRYGVTGLFNYPWYIAFEVLGPVVEFISYFLVILAWYLGIFNSFAILLFIVLAWAYSTVLTVACIFLNTITFNIYRNFIDVLNMLFMTVIQMAGFRQYHALCCFMATVQYFFNRFMGKPL